MDVQFTNIGARILLRLKELGLKQADLCRETNLSTTAISQYCTEKRIPDTSSLYKISKVLHTSAEWLLTGENATIEDKTSEDILCDGIPLDDIEIEIVAMYRTLDLRGREDLVDYLTMKYKKAIGRSESAYTGINSANDQTTEDSSAGGDLTSGIA